jgi:hypothetical protein
MMLQYRVSSRKIRLQAQEFVAFRRLNQARLRNLATPFVPDLQRVLTLFDQPLVFATDRCFDGELFAHKHLSSPSYAHFVLQQT